MISLLVEAFSPRQSSLGAQLIGLLRQGLLGSPTNVYTADLRLGLASADAVVVCPPMELRPGTNDVVTNPSVVLEVLSKSTEAYDRGDKLAGYLAERLRRTGGALQEANARAATAERLAMLGRIAAGLAHEIRNPLGSIRGSIELLREAPGLTEEDRQLCDIIQREAGRLNHLVSDMMDLARPRRPQPEAVDVAALARDVVELASRSERSGAGDVAVEYDGPRGPAWATCDGAQMKQVLWNLVRNAVQASGAGSTVRVSVGEEEEGGPSAGVVMAVSDSGPGIAPTSRDKIFDAFFTTRSQGAGIGLAVVRRIIEDHAAVGASIEVRNRSESGASGAPDDAAGATFEVRLARAPLPGRRSATPRPDLASDLGVTPGENVRSRLPEK